jgi:hypothetical protein
MLRRLTALPLSAILLVLSVTAVFAWGSRIEGRPASFSAGSASGVYFWHERDDGLHLRTTDPENVDHRYTGTITTDGTFHDLDKVLLEKDDSASIDATGHVLTFSFHTYSGIDGIDFYIRGGTQQTLNLQLDGRQLAPTRIFLGEDSVHPEADPFTVLRDP